MSEEDVRQVLHADKVSIGIKEDGFVLYIEKPDGNGVALPIDEEAYNSLEKDFILTEKPSAFN